ncbi:EEF1A lysine methyltransferase 4 [Bienertia sinuspersici]
MTLGIGGTQSYGDPSYWDNRYNQEESPFDWYQKYSALAPLLHLLISPSQRTLVIGCGNSPFSEGMADDGFEDIVNIDISPVVIEAMQKKYANHPRLKYITMDVRDMSTFETGSFDAVIDKGTLDSILCGNNSKQNSNKMLQEVERVLKDKGIYILITYAAPSYRLNLLKSIKWKIKLHVIEKIVCGVKSEDQQKWELTRPIPYQQGKSMEEFIGKTPDVHYIYVCTKDDSLEQGELDASVYMHDK